MKTEIKFHEEQGLFFNCGPQPHIFFGGVGAVIAALKIPSDAAVRATMPGS